MKNEQARSVLIFGGAGFIGSNLARHMLLRTEAKVHIFDNLSRTGVHHNVEWLRKLAPHRDRLQVTVGDIRDAQLVEKAVSAATEIYHLAAQVAVTTSIADPRLDLEVNVGGAFNVLDAARRCGHRPFLLFTSTNKVYGNLGLPEPIVTPTRYDYPGCPGISESQPLDFHSLMAAPRAPPTSTCMILPGFTACPPWSSACRASPAPGNSGPKTRDGWPISSIRPCNAAQ